MATESLVPSGDIAGASDWVKTGSPPDSDDATYTEIDEGIAGADSDTTYNEQPNQSPTFSTTIEFDFSNPVGTPNTGSGADSWTLRVRAKHGGAATPDSFTVAVYEGASLRAGPFDHAAALTSSYQTFSDTFDPAAITNTSNLKLRLVGAAAFTPLSQPRVTAADLVIQLAATGNPAGSLALKGAGR